QYRRLVKRLGDKRALVAVAHSLIVIVYQLLTRKEVYRDLGGDYFERRQPEALVQRLTRQIEKLGYSVTVAPPAPT
ncbi:MAG: IS110 family transposase, partial [Chloroflexota bacterium]|nr:IS110 family transposase [Chloroflexota bacterium]